MASNNDFLSNLGDVLGQQFLNSDNKLTSLDISQNGKVKKFGQLGDFSNKVDQTADRSYTIEGFYKNHLNNPRPKQREIVMQDPEATILVKKRWAGSLAENYRLDLMDAQDRLFYKTTKFLFQNKCKQIAAFEALSKIEKVSTQIGQVDYHLLPILFGLTDLITDLPGALSNDFGGSNPTTNLGSFKNVVDQVREVVAFNQDFRLTTWHTNINDMFQSLLGEGTGVMEFTNVLNFDTTTSLNFGEGNFKLSFSDPYRLMKITNNDIDKAISDATNPYYSNIFVQLGSIADQTLSLQKQQLNLIRQARGVNQINFIVNPNTLLGKRVSAFIDLLGFEIKFQGSSVGDLLSPDNSNIDPSALQNSTELIALGAGNQGLNSEEAELFNNIISALFNQLSLNENTRRRANYNQQDASQGKMLNDVRKKMKLHYANKWIIQPMDSVSIFISSKKKYDSEINGGLDTSFNSLGLFQGFNNLFKDIQNTLNLSAGFSAEKSIFVGNEFPNWLWLAMRSKFVADKEGICVFTGLVENVGEGFSEGLYTLNVSGQDNAAYFKYGLVNIKPSLDVYNGPLFDPLTPFNLEFDSVSGVAKSELQKTSPELLPENSSLFTSVFLRNKNGLLAGVQATAQDYLNPDNDIYSSSATRQSYYDPEGMIYKWKEGIATLTMTADTYNSTTGHRGVSITKNPFAGQDIMNVLSLLITGEPYNYITYYKAAIQSGDNLRRDPNTNQPSSVSYYRSLRNDLKNRNGIYGDFVPFKLLTMDESSLEKIISGQLSALASNDELNTLLNQRASLADQLNVLNSTTDKGTVNQVAQKIAQIDSQVAKININLQNQMNDPNNPGLKFLGNDVSFNQDPLSFNTGNNSAVNTNADARRQLRRQIAFLTRRLAWKVRANEDNNLLVIDDSYDKDYDIQSFEKSLSGGLSLFQSDYQTIAQQIETVAKKLELEVFANTQGHIEIRPQKYNRMPSSVFYQMFKLKGETGVQVFPQFLEDLFTNQLTELFNQIGAVETQIRLYCLALGQTTDDTCITFINKSNSLTSSNVLSLDGSQFNFISNPDGNITQSQDIINLQSNPDQLVQTIQTKLDVLSSQSSISAFSLSSRAHIVQNIVQVQNGQISTNSSNTFKSLSELKSDLTEQSREDLLTHALFAKTGQQFDFSQLFGNSGNSGQQQTLSSSDVLRLTNQIAIFLSSRQQLIKQAANALQNLQDGLSLNTDKGDNKLLFPNLYGNKKIPQIFEHMIEDESYDDLGVGSGSRYVIKNRDIISYELKEAKPQFTNIEVNGTYDLFINKQTLPTSSNGGNDGFFISKATAVDYDMWRMYGIQGPQQPIDAPFLHDPDSQLAPYSVAMMTRSRGQIFQGSLTVVGNEYQQPGEVIYLEEEDFLYYIQSVSHNFNYGGNFTTSMSLTFGHNPGEYIPTPLDVVGKVLYKNNRKTASFDHRRQGSVFNQEHLGTFVANLSQNIPSLSLTEDPSDLNDGIFASGNAATLQKIFNQAAAALSIQTDFSNPILELRIFYNTNSQFNSINSVLFNYADIIKNILTGSQDTTTLIPTSVSKSNKSALTPFSDQIQSVAVDINSAGEFRYPSSQAFYLARQITEKYGSQLDLLNISSSSQTAIDNSIYNFIIDAWIYFKNPKLDQPT